MTNDRHDPDATPGLHDEFWGQQSEWTPQRHVPSSGHRGLGATIGRWWNGLLGGTSDGGRVHGEVSHDADVDHADRGHRNDEWVGGDDHVPAGDDTEIDAWAFEPEPQPSRSAGVDPLIARLGGLAVILTLAAPLALGITASGSDADDATVDAMADPPPTAMVSPAISTLPADVPATAPTERTAEVSPAAAAAPTPTTDADAEVVADTESAPPAASATASLDSPAASELTDTEPTTTVSACGSRYELAAGDYWIRIADAAGVSLADLLDANGASIDTVLVPGRSICLPSGASTPAPPTTAAPVSSASPTTTSSNSDSTARPPVTTAAPAPTTTAPARPAAVPESEATAIIRAVWPDDLEERALEIAWRESNHRSNVNNWCCYGLFQIHWEAHRSWLATIGVTSVSQLYDPTVNANAAYTLYQRSGGWGPWGG